MRLLRREDGGNLVEFAIALPLVLLLTVGLLQAGLLAYASIMAGEAARHGARMGSVAQADAAVVAHVNALDEAQAAFPIAHPRVQILAPGGIPGSELTIQVTYDVPNLFYLSGLSSLLPVVGDPTVEVTRRVTFRQEGW